MELIWFQGEFVITGIPDEDAEKVITDLTEDLNARHHLRPKRVIWDVDRKQAIVRVDFEGINADEAGKQMAEELIEVAAVVVPSFERLRVETICVSAVLDI